MREKIETFSAFPETMGAFRSKGAFLVSGKEANPMTVAWGSVGFIWGKPILTLMVRPSRYSYALMEECSDFSLNIPGENELIEELALCGSASGRDRNKIEACGFHLEAGIEIATAHIKECLIHYECRRVHKNDIQSEALDAALVKNFYPAGNFHTLYYGEILGVYKEK